MSLSMTDNSNPFILAAGISVNKNASDKQSEARRRQNTGTSASGRVCIYVLGWSAMNEQANN
jgi:hypothetical protein